MRRYMVFFALVLALTACGAPAETMPTAESADEKILSAVPDTTAAPPREAAEEDLEEDVCAHQPAGEDHTLEYAAVGYCGNTVTAVSREERVWDEPWEASFWGDDSVALTDLLLYLDYSGDVCRCLPEYNVDTEFGTGYGVNLTAGYARYGGGQSALTEEQTKQIREILERQGEFGSAAK